MAKNSSYRGASGNWNIGAVMRDASMAWRLFWNPQVPATLKLLLPVAALIYWVSPVDLIPGLPFDDIALLILALKLFVQLAPEAAKRSAPSQPDAAAGDADTVDTTWRVIDD